MSTLEIEAPGHELRLVELTETVTTLGRLPACSVQLQVQGVSRMHAEIRADGDRWVVRDLGSHNGTRVNGAPVDQQELRDGDTIRLGPVVALFRAPSTRQAHVVDTVPRVDLEEVPALVDGDPRRAVQLVELLAAAQALDDRLVRAVTVDEVLEGVLTSCTELLGAETAYFLERVSGHSTAFQVRASRAGDDSPTQPLEHEGDKDRLPLSSEVLSLLLQREKGVRVALQPDGDEEEDAVPPSVLAVPIFGPDGIVAALVLRRDPERESFTRRQLLVLMGVGDQTSRLLSRARRVRQARRRGEVVGRWGGLVPSATVERMVDGDEPTHDDIRQRAVVALAIRPRGWDLVTSRLGAAATVTLLREMERAMIPRVLQRGGVVERFVDGTLVAVWGVLERADDDVARALHSAVLLRDWLRVLQSERSEAESPLPTPGFAIGLNQGTATVGWTGLHHRPSLHVLGDPVDLSIRMAEIADPGDIVLRRDLAAVVSGTEVEPLPSVEGPDSPLLLCRLLSLSAAPLVASRYDESMG